MTMMQRNMRAQDPAADQCLMNGTATPATWSPVAVTDQGGDYLDAGSVRLQ